MAFPDEEDLDRRGRRKRDRRVPSPLDDNDWSAGSESHRQPVPYRTREAKRGVMETAEPRLSSQRHGREPPLQPKPNAVMSVSRRPSAVPKRARDPLVYEHTSGTDSRRSSRRDSPRYHISTPGSKRSSHTTLSGSDEESNFTPSTDEDEHGLVSVERYRDSPKRDPSHRRPRQSRGRYPTTKLKVPLVPEVVEAEEQEDDDESSEEEEESEDEDSQEEEVEVETEPRLRARLGRRHIQEEDFPPPSQPRHPRRRLTHEEEDIPSPAASRPRRRFIPEEDIPSPAPSRRRGHLIHEEDDIPSPTPSRRRDFPTHEEHIPSPSPSRHRGRIIPEDDFPSPSPSRHRYSSYRAGERPRDSPRSEDHYRPQSSRRCVAQY